LLWTFLAAILVTVCVLYLSHRSKDQLKIAPNAQREIEKAKHR